MNDRATAEQTETETDPDRFAELRRLTEGLEAAEGSVDEWRAWRNEEINRLRRLPEPPSITEIARVAKVRHGYVSRIVLGRGVPASGR